MGYGAGLKQAYDLRDAMATEALALLSATPPDDLEQRCRRAVAATSLVKGWEAAVDRVRIARGQPLPGSRRPSAKPQRQQVRRGLAPPQSKQLAQSTESLKTGPSSILEPSTPTNTGKSE